MYKLLPASVILDNFIISMQVAQKGFRIVYEPQAYAVGLPSHSIAEEQKKSQNCRWFSGNGVAEFHVPFLEELKTIPVVSIASCITMDT